MYALTWQKSLKDTIRYKLCVIILSKATLLSFAFDFITFLFLGRNSKVLNSSCHFFTINIWRWCLFNILKNKAIKQFFWILKEAFFPNSLLSPNRSNYLFLLLYQQPFIFVFSLYLPSILPLLPSLLWNPNR